MKIKLFLLFVSLFALASCDRTEREIAQIPMEV
ncbi:MAG: gliding motility lipoprotein GldB, partial [Capnocytophaga sp.]